MALVYWDVKVKVRQISSGVLSCPSDLTVHLSYLLNAWAYKFLIQYRIQYSYSVTSSLEMALTVWYLNTIQAKYEIYFSRI
jgi:hypothetical protein